MKVKKAVLKIYIVRLSGLIIGLLIGFLLPSKMLFIDDTADVSSTVSTEHEYWACPMLCVTLESPGTCPVCGMDLELFISTGDEVVLTRYDQEMIDLSVTEVQIRTLHTEFTAPGIVEFDESKTYSVTSWVSGRLDRLYIEYIGDHVESGQAVADIYSVELFEAKQELSIAVSNSLGSRLISLAKDKLRLLGVSNTEINRIAGGGEISSNSTIVAPVSGTVTDIHVTDGEYVSTGKTIIEISDVSSLLLTVTLTEDQTGLVNPGQVFDFYLHSVSGEKLSGIIDTVDPHLSDTRQAAEARAILQDENDVFFPGQSASVTFSIPYENESIISIPRSSVLALGERHIAYKMTAPLLYLGGSEGELRLEEIKFMPVQITVGPLCSDGSGDLYYPVLSGLEEEDVVALNGAFLIDSQAELLGLPSLLGD
ncbi:MAG: efflux RND transporter periplasmic adaptor subunit [FCB group bacterium]|nr:efflux RND transporter periplasmic adaptor subunit [FCB group bacterium]